MWFLTSPQLLHSSISIITFVSSDVLGKLIGVTIQGIGTTISYLSQSNENLVIKRYQDDLESLDIELKLKLIQNWLNQINMEMIVRNPHMEMIYKAISDSCHSIAEMVERINTKINNHKKMWFHNWRTLYLDEEIYQIKKYNKILKERLFLINLEPKFTFDKNMSSNQLPQLPYFGGFMPPKEG